MTRLLKLTLRFTWLSFAILVIVSALLLTGTRVVLSNIDQRKDIVENWVSRIIARPVTLGEITGYWRGWSPTIDIQALSVLQDDRAKTLMHFERGAISISIVDSLLKREISVDRIALGGVALTIQRDSDGQFSVAGMPPSRWPVAQWLENQNQFSLNGADITFIDALDEGNTHYFKNLSLSITRAGNERYLAGSTNRGLNSSEFWSFRIVTDSSLQSSSWNGSSQIKIRNADLTSTIALLGAPENIISRGSLNAVVAGSWRRAKLQELQFTVAARDVAFAFDDAPPLESLNVSGNASRNSSGWSVGFRPQKIDSLGFGAANSPTLRTEWRKDVNTQRWTINDLDIAVLAELVQKAVPTNSAINKILEQAEPTGFIPEASVAFDRRDNAFRYSIFGEINALSWKGFDDIPGVKKLRGKFRINQAGGYAEFNHSPSVELSSKKWLSEPLKITDMTGRIVWRSESESQHFFSDQFTLEVEGFRFTTSGEVIVENPDDIFLDLVTHFDQADISNFAKLVPIGLLPSKGERWAKNALQGGQLNYGSTLFRGRVNDFPFDQNEGVFQARFGVESLTLQYGRLWPPADQITGSLEINNRAVKFNVDEGNMYSAQVGGSSIEIPDVFTKNRYVRLTGSAQVLPDDVGRYIENSPLKNTKAVRFQELKIDNEFKLELDLDLGIFPEGEKIILGQAHFANNRIEAPKFNLALDDVTGNVSFTRHDWYGEGLSALYDGQRVGVILNGGLDDPNYDTEFRMTGTTDATFFLKHINKYAPTVGAVLAPRADNATIEGSAPWKIVMSLPAQQAGQNETPRKLAIESSLLGLKINLPWPLGKAAEELLPFSVTTYSLAGKHRTILADVGDRARAQVVQSVSEGNTYQLTSAEIVFGQDSIPFADDLVGISVHGNIPRLIPDEWQRLLSDSPAAFGRDVAELPVSLDLTIAESQFMRSQFSALKFNANREVSGWEIGIDGDQLSGSATIPSDVDLPALFNFKRILLDPIKQSGSPRSINPKSIRPFQIKCEQLQIGQIDFGNASIVTERTITGLSLTQALFENADFKLDSSGSWDWQNTTHRTQLEISLTGESLANLLSRLGYDAATVEGGETSISVDAFWPGMPTEFSLETLRGHLGLTINSGRLLDIEPGGGRLFGLLSLQTLPRRLSLDFNDLFSKGFSFDSIQGIFSLEQGNAYTNSLLMDGPSARIQIAGRTGLAEKDYDQRVTVTPALSNSIPIASALFGPAGIGVGAVIYLGQKMFKSIPEQMDKFLSREYTITGAWSAPVIERI